MKVVLTILFLLPVSTFPQSASFNFYSPENIKKFADHLFCEGDYLRSIEQYELTNYRLINDTIRYKLMIGYSSFNLFQKSDEIFHRMNTKAVFYPYAYLLSLKNKLITERKPLEIKSVIAFDSLTLNSLSKLINISQLYSDTLELPQEKLISLFNKKDSATVSVLYNLKIDSPYKSPVLAGVLSAVIPGSGKMYVGEWGDGITALVVTGLFAFLAYDNFQADHTTRAWIFSGLGAFFYAGNIYGSIASAQIFNAKINFEFNNGLKLFLEQNNYFIPQYDFCQ